LEALPLLNVQFLTSNFSNICFHYSKKIINALTEFEKGTVQVFDEDLIAGEKHIQFAFLHAIEAFEDGKRCIMSFDGWPE